jgi:hypothetical protein
VLLMPGAIAVSFCCKAEGHQACGAGDGGPNFAKNTATPPCCALLALRHIHACRNTFGHLWQELDEPVSVGDGHLGPGGCHSESVSL